MTTQFGGETAYQAIVNDNSLNIEEEADFLEFIAAQGYSEKSDLADLRALYSKWSNASEKE